MSWIITDKATGEAVFETFSAKTAAAVNLDRYIVQEAGQYLAGLNYRSELTPEGEQLVIPGCERNRSSKAKQLDLF